MFSSEFKDNQILQWALGVLILAYFLAFHHWIDYSATAFSSLSTFTYTYPPYWQQCNILYFLEPLPGGYSQTFFYMIFLGVMAYGVYFMSKKKWKEVQLLLVPFFLWHAFNVFFLTDKLLLNYEFYVFVYGAVLLFLPHKEFFLKLTFVAYYSISTVAKIHPAWIEGGYFTNLKLGLPIFPDWSIPFWTNLIIIAEMVGAWFLFSRNMLLQRLTLIFFVVFHLYSGIFVMYRYPATALPMLLVLFGPWYRVSKVPLDKKSLLGWFFVGMLVFMQFIPKFIEGDEKLTLEGNKYGLFMFESNHQCIFEITYFKSNGSSFTQIHTYANARNRCNPYNFWFSLSRMCEHDSTIDRISLKFDHSINGNPFLRIVDTENVCDLEYKAFSHNEWLKTENDNPEVIGWPVKNYYGRGQ